MSWLKVQEWIRFQMENLPEDWEDETFPVEMNEQPTQEDYDAAEFKPSSSISTPIKEEDIPW